MTSTELSLNRFTVHQILTGFGYEKTSMSHGSYHQFPLFKNHLKGIQFGTLDNTQKSVTDELKGIPVEAFQTATNNGKNASVAV
jgi:hypothetical protein